MRLVIQALMPKQWKASHSLDVLEGWPAQIPDLNQIENVWSELTSYLRRQKAGITNTESLKRAITDRWEAMPLELAEKLVASCEKEILGSIDPNGDAMECFGKVIIM